MNTDPTPSLTAAANSPDVDSQALKPLIDIIRSHPSAPRLDSAIKSYFEKITLGTLLQGKVASFEQSLWAQREDLVKRADGMRNDAISRMDSTNDELKYDSAAR